MANNLYSEYKFEYVEFILVTIMNRNAEIHDTIYTYKSMILITLCI